MANALSNAGVAEPVHVEVRHLADGHLAAALPLTAGQPSPALVWDERYGWRTATSRRHPIGKDTTNASEGEGIRYLGSGLTPNPDAVLEQLADGRKGSKRPKV
ncbi:DUF6292 family protein [Streptomyces sp. MS2.AVA.5]|uniref:DUF6292 family protein n=1 Tax=Streptomyces achmelvichensis TaxID=3134111 RepID=A0ACC6PMB8_9ACTN